MTETTLWGEEWRDGLAKWRADRAKFRVGQQCDICDAYRHGMKPRSVGICTEWGSFETPILVEHNQGQKCQFYRPIFMGGTPR